MHLVAVNPIQAKHAMVYFYVILPSISYLVYKEHFSTFTDVIRLAWAETQPTDFLEFPEMPDYCARIIVSYFQSKEKKVCTNRVNAKIILGYYGLAFASVVTFAPDTTLEMDPCYIEFCMWFLARFVCQDLKDQFLAANEAHKKVSTWYVEFIGKDQRDYQTASPDKNLAAGDLFGIAKKIVEDVNFKTTFDCKMAMDPVLASLSCAWISTVNDPEDDQIKNEMVTLSFVAKDGLRAVKPQDHVV